MKNCEHALYSERLAIIVRAEPHPWAIHRTPAMQTITERASKAEILSAAAELTDSQADRIATLEQRQGILLGVLAILTALYIL